MDHILSYVRKCGEGLDVTVLPMMIINLQKGYTIRFFYLRCIKLSLKILMVILICRKVNKNLVNKKR